MVNNKSHLFRASRFSFREENLHVVLRRIQWIQVVLAPSNSHLIFFR